MSDQKKSCGRRYDRQFKEDAVALVRSGRSQAQVARDLQLSSGRLSTWMQQFGTGQPLAGPKTLDAQTPEQRELLRLRQEVDYLRQQRDILKKACGRGGGGDKRGLADGRVLSVEPSGAR